jgi:phosphoenolpyruvate carboxykinase (ATP)
MLNAALDGSLSDREFWVDQIFGFRVPKSCPGVPDSVLNPSESWPSEEEYMAKYRQLALNFIANFKKYETSCPELVQSGPRVQTA